MSLKTIDTSLYDEEVVFKAVHLLGDKCTFYIEKTDNFITIRYESDLPDLDALLEASLIEAKVRQIVANQTSHIRDIIITKAFSEALPGRQQ